MNNPSVAITDKNPQEVPSLLVPFGGATLLFPTVSIAEMVGYQNPEPVDGSPPWLLGEVSWRNQVVPVICYEVLNGQPFPGIAENSRLAVVNATGLDENLGFFGMLTQGIPHLTRVTQSELDVNEGTEAMRYDKLPVIVSGEMAVIPDVKAVEEAYLDWLETHR